MTNLILLISVVIATLVLQKAIVYLRTEKEKSSGKSIKAIESLRLRALIVPRDYWNRRS